MHHQFEHKRSGSVTAASQRMVVNRRTFVGLALGALAAWLTACRRAVVAPASTAPPAQTTKAVPTATPRPPTHTPVPPTATPLPTATSVPPTATLPPTSSPIPTSTPSPPTATPVPPTYTPVPPTPTNPPPPTATPTRELSRSALTAHWPATETSRVVVVRHGGVWAGDAPEPAIVLHMLDAGLSTLTGVSDALAVWRALFDPDERVLLKVNCISYNGPTQPAVTYAVAQRLQDAGLPAESILIFDRTDEELASAGYTLNDGGAGVQCHGQQGTGTEAALSQARVRFYREFDAYDAIVNLPTPKQHGSAGISASMKNHYGSVDRPGALHGNWCDPAIAELNAQPNVRDKTRLVVGAALSVSPFDWNQPERENALLLSFDTVALDTVARDILVRHRQARGWDAGYLVEGARHLNTAQSLNLGATDANLIDLREVTLA
jgi:hypothetical protein